MAVSAELYVHQWLKAAGGNVSAVWAFSADRVTFTCSVCSHCLTLPGSQVTAENTEFSLQEFVAYHNGKYHNGLVQKGKVIPLTADFKSPQAAQIEFEQKAKLYTPAPKIDGKSEAAEILEQKVKSIAAEYEQKVNDQAIANKIKILQMSDKENIAFAAKQQEAAKKAIETLATLASKGSNFQTGVLTTPDVAKWAGDAFKKLKAKPDPLNYGGWENDWGTGMDDAPPKPQPKPDKPLVRSTGRKFR